MVLYLFMLIGIEECSLFYGILQKIKIFLIRHINSLHHAAINMPSPKVPKPKNTSRVSHRAESVSLHYIRLLLLCTVLKEEGWPVHAIVQSVYIFVSMYF